MHQGGKRVKKFSLVTFSIPKIQRLTKQGIWLNKILVARRALGHSLKGTIHMRKSREVGAYPLPVFDKGPQGWPSEKKNRLSKTFKIGLLGYICSIILVIKLITSEKCEIKKTINYMTSKVIFFRRAFTVHCCIIINVSLRETTLWSFYCASSVFYRPS